MRPPAECRWSFPTHDQWDDDDDVVAVGADLAPDTLLFAYSHGMFPMFLDKRHSELGWWSPVQRGIIPLHGLRITKSMRNSARKFHCTVNAAFEDVMVACATTHTQGNWIDAHFIKAYAELHRLGHAHSVEVWNDNNELVGGLYGVRINNFFAGESMFHRETDASKVALMFLVDLMTLAGMTLLDTQWQTEHLASLGCIEVPRDAYLALLGNAVGSTTSDA